MKTISIVTACFNEEANVEELDSRVRRVMAGFPRYNYEHLSIDNCLRDNTVAILKEIASHESASEENPIMFRIRKAYYSLVNKLSSIETFQNFTGFGLYDRPMMDVFKTFHDPYSYFRGIIAEIGLPHAEIRFQQPRRVRGITKNNFYAPNDMAMLAITNLAKVPLRVMTFFGSVRKLAPGILAEYIGSIHTFVQNRPLVVERERVNFEYPAGPASY